MRTVDRMSPNKLRHLAPGATVYHDGAPVTFLSSDSSGQTGRIRDNHGAEREIQHRDLHARPAPPFHGAAKVAAVYVERWRDGTFSLTVVRKPADDVGTPEQLWKLTGVSHKLLPEALDSASSVVERLAAEVAGGAS